MARDLRGRIERLKKHATESQRDRPAVSNRSANLEGAAKPGALGDWTRIAPLTFTLTTKVPIKGTSGSGMQSRLLGRHIRIEDLCFMDTETTGLSGGAGTLVFLVGSGTYRNGEATLTQTLLADFPGEPDFLGVVREQLWSSPVWVSYNGKSFDSRLLETRFLMNGQSVLLPEQLDLLYWARRTWKKRIQRCGLSDIEREVLGVERTGDVPGIEIPDRYFEFLRTGTVDGLLPVFSHHRQDIVSLIGLYFRLEEVLEHLQDDDRDPAFPEPDRVALGRYLADRGDEAGEALLTKVVRDPAPWETLDERERSARLLGRLLRKTGRADVAREFWARLWADGSVVGGVELAKHLEHRERDFAAALTVALDLINRVVNETDRDELLHRIRRLKRKTEH